MAVKPYSSCIGSLFTDFWSNPIKIEKSPLWFGRKFTSLSLLHITRKQCQRYQFMALQRLWNIIRDALVLTNLSGHLLWKHAEKKCARSIKVQINMVCRNLALTDSSASLEIVKIIFSMWIKYISQVYMSSCLKLFLLNINQRSNYVTPIYFVSWFWLNHLLISESPFIQRVHYSKIHNVPL